MTTIFIYGQVSILNFIIGAALFLLAPKSKLERVQAFVNGYYTSRSERPYMERMQEVILSRLGDLSATFTSLASSFDTLSEKRAGEGKINLTQVFDDTAQKICRQCGLRSHCWDKEVQLTHKTIVCMGKKLEEKGYADVLDIVPEFRENASMRANLLRRRTTFLK